MSRRVVAGLALSGLVAGCASPGRTEGMVPTALARPGWCHRLADPAEFYAPSDVAPPVPCSTPHQTETLATVRLPPWLTGLPERPGGLANVVCRRPIDALRAFLGADDLDRHWGIDVSLKVPTRREWAKGVRVGRCDLTPGGGARSVPVLTHGLRGALRRTDSAAIRHCRIGSISLTCDRPHTAEEVGGWTGIAGPTYPGPKTSARLLNDQCWRNAERYAGGAVGVRAVAGQLTATDWQQGRHTTDCWIVADDGRPTRGTLRADLTAPRPIGPAR